MGDSTNDKAVERAAKLAAARAAAAAREAARQEALEDAEIERQALIEKFEASTNGKLDEQFAVVDCTSVGAGFVVLELGSPLLFKTYKAAKDMEDAMVMMQFVASCVKHPALDVFKQTANERPVVLLVCANKLVDLYGGGIATSQKK